MKLESSYAVELDTKGLTDDGTFEGYASPFNTADRGRDIVMPGAFTKSLAARPPSKVRMLRNHDQREPIGVWVAMSEDSTGLHVKGRLIEATRLGAETKALVQEGALDGLSIGFRTKQATRDHATGNRRLHEIDLHEVSIVTFGMHPDALIARKHDDPERARALVAALNRAAAALRT